MFDTSSRLHVICWQISVLFIMQRHSSHSNVKCDCVSAGFGSALLTESCQLFLPHLTFLLLQLVIECHFWLTDYTLYLVCEKTNGYRTQVDNGTIIVMQLNWQCYVSQIVAKPFHVKSKKKTRWVKIISRKQQTDSISMKQLGHHVQGSVSGVSQLIWSF